MPEKSAMGSKDLSPPVMGPLVRRAPLLIASLYVLLSLAWIAFSDWLVALFAGGGPLAAEGITHLQTYKGCGFILVTGGLLYYLVNTNVRAMRRSQGDMQKRLEGIAKQYQMLFQSSPSAMMIYEPGTLRILAINDVGVLLLGYSRDELLAMTAYNLLVEEERPRAEASSHSPQGGLQQHGVWQVRRRDRRLVFIDAVTHQVDFDGEHAGIVLMTDVTERLRTERALSQHRSQLEQRVADRTAELSLANKKLRAEVEERHRIEADLRAATVAAESASTAKSTFLANTSHEIRTPLTSILGYADLLSDKNITEAQRSKYLDVLQQNAQHLLALIDDLLDLSRAEMGKVRVVFDEHSPREIAQQAVELLRPRAADKALTLTLHFASHIPSTIRTDGVRLRQVLLNLLSNAIKFTPGGSGGAGSPGGGAGRVSLTIRGHDQDDLIDSGMVRFEVCDTGIGMAPEHVDRVFEPFYQVEQGVTRRFGGSGLGLAISRQLAQQMGGMLNVQSALGLGSTFTLELPVEQPEMGELIEEKPAPGSGGIQGTILLAEDNPNIRLLVEEYLRRAGVSVVTAGDGAQAVGLLQQALATGTPTVDLVLLDLHMPVLDGAQAMRQMRLAGFAGPIVGLTADYAEKSADQWAREGWDAMAAKPIDRQAFIPLLARMMTQSREASGDAVAQLGPERA